MANLLVHRVTSEGGPSLGLPSSLTTPSPGMGCSCNRRSELQHKIQVQPVWHSCTPGKGELWDMGVEYRNW